MKTNGIGPSIRILVFTLCLAGCSSGTKITGSWKAPEAMKYKTFFVTVLNRDLTVRTAVEGNLSSSLTKSGVNVTKSVELFSPATKIETKTEREQVIKKIQAGGYEAIMAISLIKKEENTYYVPGTTAAYDPKSLGGFSGMFPGYYDNGVSTYSTPGYYQTDKIYFIESNVYDGKTLKLVWSAQSQTFNPVNIKAASSEFSSVVVDALKKDKLIGPSGQSQ